MNATNQEHPKDRNGKIDFLKQHLATQGNKEGSTNEHGHRTNVISNMDAIEEEDENVIFEIEGYGEEDVALPNGTASMPKVFEEAPNATASMPKNFEEAVDTLKQTESNKSGQDL